MTGSAERVAPEAKERILRYLQARPGRGATTATLKAVSGLPLHRDVYWALDDLAAAGLVKYVPRRGPVAVQHNEQIC